MSKDFFRKLEENCREKDSLLCVGLDPRLDLKEGDSPYDKLLEFNKNIIEQTSDYAVCYKPNIAFFEVYGSEGLRAFEDVIQLVPESIPLLIDAKRNDIGPTAKAYADSIFGHFDADAVTLSPYMGRDAADPFLEYEGRGLFLLCRTTNPGAPAFQDLICDTSAGKRKMYIQTAVECTSWSERVGLVVAGNDSEALRSVRAVCPDTWFLAPGIGAQGGSMTEAVAAGMRKDGLGILPNVSRGIAAAESPEKAAKEFCEKMREARREAEGKKVSGLEIGLKRDLINGLIKNECFRVGEFTLKSGKKSPFYVDMRRTSSDPDLMRVVGAAYAELLEKLNFDRVAGIPVAAISLATAASMAANCPMIYPRMVQKAHGTGNKIEGNWNPGEKIVLLDDLITTGKSKIEAIEILRQAGLVVEDLVVLLERGSQGRKDMEAAGINLHSFLQVEEFLQPCRDLELIDDDQYESMLAYARQE